MHLSQLLAQAAWIAWHDSQAIFGDPYAWPPPPAPTDEQKRESDRLRILASRLLLKAREAGYVGSDGRDAVFVGPK